MTDHLVLQKATGTKAPEIHAVQRQAFLPLLKKYGDHPGSPASESIKTLAEKIDRPESDCYVFLIDNEIVGSVRITKQNKATYKISALCVLPRFQNLGIAQESIKRIESIYPHAQKWILDTILEEDGNCHLYEKLGYVRTGTPHKINEHMTLIDYEKIIY